MSEILVAVLVAGSTIIIALLLYKVRKRFQQAQTGEVEVRTLKGLWTQVESLLKSVRALEVRVTALETENRRLVRLLEQFRLLVRRLWSIIVDNGLSTDIDLAVEVAEVLEEETDVLSNKEP